MRVLILGASGFVGRRLAQALRARGDDVRAASLRDPSAAAREAAGCEAVVNLAGEPVAQRWTPRVKRAIEESRTVLPGRFLDALEGVPDRPKIYVSASAIGYYGTSETAAFTEESAAGNDFLARVCVGWEATAQRAASLGMRVACVRTAIALDASGGALARLLPPFRAGMGGRIGSGRQWFSWIHVDDLTGIYLLALDRADGPLNASAPHPVTNADFTRALGAALHRPSVMPVPTFALRAMLGEGANALLEGQRVLPQRTLALGYRFVYPELDAALAAALRGVTPR